jgi:proteasome lid subunit RPN8/RPN11
MTLTIEPDLLQRIHAHGEETYPEEGAGLLLGEADATSRLVADIFTLDNAREDSARHNRYQLSPQDLIRVEKEADERGLDVIGVFHSHPDHPNQPSEFDREHALPWYSYLITSVEKGHAVESRSWRLLEDRSQFEEESIHSLE